MPAHGLIPITMDFPTTQKRSMEQTLKMLTQTEMVCLIMMRSIKPAQIL